MRTLLAIAAISALSGCAHAWEPTDKDFHVIDKSVRHPQVRSWKRVHKPKHEQVRVVIRLPKPEEDRCEKAISATGDKAKSIAAARMESQKAWKGEVQFELGNKYLDIGNAQDVTFQCSSASVPRLGGLVESAASKVLPIEDYSCKMRARPCAAPVQREEDGK